MKRRSVNPRIQVGVPLFVTKPINVAVHCKPRERAKTADDPCVIASRRPEESADAADGGRA
jgi:hypothetical protein